LPRVTDELTELGLFRSRKARHKFSSFTFPHWRVLQKHFREPCLVFDRRRSELLKRNSGYSARRPRSTFVLTRRRSRSISLTSPKDMYPLLWRRLGRGGTRASSSKPRACFKTTMGRCWRAENFRALPLRQHCTRPAAVSFRRRRHPGAPSFSRLPGMTTASGEGGDAACVGFACFTSAPIVLANALISSSHRHRTSTRLAFLGECTK
jgi:hypothetical protein